MKKFIVLLLAMGFVMATAGMAGASIYASSIVEGTTQHNWIGGCHGELDASVILGAPDGQLTGWGGGDPESSITLGFDATLADGDGDDLIIYGFGPYATDVSVSTDNNTWTSLGTLSRATPGTVISWEFDFGDFSVVSANYVKLTSGQGKFIDAVEGVNPVPVPAAVWLLGSGLISLVGIRRRSH